MEKSEFSLFTSLVALQYTISPVPAPIQYHKKCKYESIQYNNDHHLQCMYMPLKEDEKDYSLLSTILLL
ncbi:MAG: hypothetical protein KA407_03005 [Spirochaetes bacterium]|nr:hypothetical protein [Spirochaetota bacterium]